MYDFNYLGLKDICKYLGVGRNTAIRLCQERPHGFPAVKVGRRYQADEELLAKWKSDWYAGKFTI